MSEPAIPPTGDPIYQPISGFALAGLLLSSAFAAMVLVSAGVAVLQGAPIFYPLWLLLIPIAGFVLCLVGRNQILGSEGTRAGLGLAKWGIGLALFSGLGYAAFFVTVGLAVAKQANDFLVGPVEPDSGFLTHLTRGAKNPADVDIAFLLSRPATGRIKLRPGDDEALRSAFDQPGPDGSAGELSRFRSQVLVRMLARAGESAVIEPLGVREWSHEKGSYKVARSYRIHTPEAVLDMILQAESTEGEAEGRLRQWFVNLNRSPIANKTFTPLGTGIEELRDQSRLYLDNVWRAKMHAGIYKDNPPRDASDWKQLFPDSPEFLKNGKNVHRAYYEQTFRELFTGRGAQTFSCHVEGASWPDWGVDGEGRFWIDQPIRMMLSGSGEIPTMSSEGRIRLRSKGPLDPAKIESPAPNVDWDVTEAAIVRARSAKGM